MSLEVEGLLKAKKVTLPPIFGVEEHEKPTLEPRKHHFSGEKADFWPPEGLFSAPGPASAVGGRKWGQLGEKIDLETFGPKIGFEGRGSWKTRFYDVLSCF